MARAAALLGVSAALLGASAGAGAASAASEAPLDSTRLLYGPGKIVPIPASIPHEEGDMVDRRIIPDLRWLAQRYPIFVTDGYSGPLPGGGGRAGCRGCHVKNSDHHNGLAVDIVPLFPSARCDSRWRGITRLARWAEPRQNRPRPPFRWVGYDRDSGHGCGHHLHLSWNHAPVREFRLASWVEALPAELTAGATGRGDRQPAPAAPPGTPPGGSAPEGPAGGSAPGEAPSASGPSGGISHLRTGGVAPRGRGD